MKLHRLEKDVTGTANFGCMWEKGKIPKGTFSDTEFYYTNENGKEIALQSRVTAYWPDGSIKWTAHCADSKALGEVVTVEYKTKDKTNTEDYASNIENHINSKSDNESEIITNNYLYKDPAQGGSVSVHNTENTIEISGKDFTAVIKKDSNELFETISSNKRLVFAHAKPVLKLEEQVESSGCRQQIIRDYTGKIENIEIEDSGDAQTVVRYEGIHECISSDNKGSKKIPFIIRLFLGTAARDIKIQHTFMYDGEEDKDYLKGIGISFESPLKGKLYNRHIKMTGDAGVFHEVCMPLSAWRPRIPSSLYEDQMKGANITDESLLKCGDSEINEHIKSITDNSPHWDTYTLSQDSAQHFCISKKLGYDDVCMIDALHGQRSIGGVAFGSENGSVMLGIRDFWQKYPGGINVSGLSSDSADVTIWFYSPFANSFDFRHYAHRGYNQVCYEGYDYKGADPCGIAVTSECALGFSNDIIPDDETVISFARSVNHPALYVASPEQYHQMKAFGYWSLPENDTEVERWLEDQLDRAFSFYKEEADNRNWYGLFNYGDFMHTYDAVRHQWKYDVGGYAWDNTELVPTLWLWNYFLRTGRADAFYLAEKLSRHASEVDVYHFGKYKGLGSRHNVRHWGCPCKEARIAMASHHRVYYYLTGDRRMEDIFDELKDNENSFLNKDPLGDFYDKDKMHYKSHARSGPDWSSLVSNWMTQWERKDDKKYKDKIITGIKDLEKAPLRLISGPDFEFDPVSVHLNYIGERTTGGTHLQVCMGAPSVWTESADLLDEPVFNQMLVELGRFALLPKDEQDKESGGLIGEREYTYPFMFTGLGAYAAANIIKGNCKGVTIGKDALIKDHEKEGHLAAKRTWKALLASLISENNKDGFMTTIVKDAGNHEKLTEIPWITTNFTAQWCLNVIIALEFIKDDLPDTLIKAQELVEGLEESAFHKA